MHRDAFLYDRDEVISIYPSDDFHLHRNKQKDLQGQRVSRIHYIQDTF
jgi:hypothetical protein